MVRKSTNITIELGDLTIRSHVLKINSDLHIQVLMISQRATVLSCVGIYVISIYLHVG